MWCLKRRKNMVAHREHGSLTGDSIHVSYTEPSNGTAQRPRLPKNSNETVGGRVYMYPWRLVDRIKAFISPPRSREGPSPEIGADAILHKDSIPPIDSFSSAPPRLEGSTGGYSRSGPPPAVSGISIRQKSSTTRHFTPTAWRTASGGSRSTTTQYQKSTYTDNFVTSETPKAPWNSNSGLRQEKAAGGISEFGDFKLETIVYEGYVMQQERSGGVLVESIWEDEENISSKGVTSVWRQRSQGGGKLRAVKTLPKRTLQMAARELLALVTLNDYDHLFVKFLGWYEDRHYIFIVMEYMEGGDLGEYIRKDPLKASADAKEITRQILKGLEVLHKRKFCHRDIKPSNILIASFEPICLRIADFGVAKLLENTTARTGWGTDNYRAPETLHLLPENLQGQKSISCALDIWSLGSLVHELLTSETPFTKYSVYEPEDSGLAPLAADSSLIRSLNVGSFHDYCKGSIEFPVGVLEKSGVSVEGIALVKSLLIANPKDRPTATQALQDPWLKEH